MPNEQQTTEERKNVPTGALRFIAGQFEFGSNGEGAKTAPIKMVARSGKPIEHWWWGRVVHDLAGMHLHKSRLPIDYCHDANEVIGYLNHFDREAGDDGAPNLVCNGALVPYKDSDRATEVIYKAAQGVPYEASINFGGDGIKVQVLGDDEVAEVNGFEFEGPGMIIREWPLRGVAVCPYGADMHTSSEFAADREIPVTFMETSKENEMTAETDPVVEADTEETEKVEAPEAVETDPATEAPSDPAEAPEAVEAEDKEAEEATEPEATEELSAESEGQRFLDAFGDKGGVWFAQGKSFQEAQTLHTKALAAENAELRQRIDAVGESRGEAEPVGAGQDQAGRLTPGLGALASAIKPAIRFAK